MAKFLISVLAFNRVEGTKVCVEAILAGGGDYLLVLTDNHSSDSTHEYFIRKAAQSRGTIHIFREAENLGFHAPNERAFRMAQEMDIPYLVLLNDDTRPPVGWLERLALAIENDPACAIAGAAGACCDITPEFRGTGGSRVEYIEGSCLMVDVKKILRIRQTLFDPNIKFMYGEDADLSLSLRRAGYRIVQVNINIEHIGAASRKSSPELRERCEAAEVENHRYLLRKWAHYMKVRCFDHRIIVKRKHAGGDVLLVTPFVRALHAQYPLCKIMVETQFPEIFYGNPNVVYAAAKILPYIDDMVIDLEMVSENAPMRHFCASYFSAGPVVLPRPKKYITEIHYDREWSPPAKGFWCAMHIGPTTWRAKNWPYERWQEVEQYLTKIGWNLALVGNGYDGNVVCHRDFRNKTTIQDLAAIIAGCDLFIGVDSFPMHVAQAVGTPTIGIFGVTESRYILTDGSRSIGCNADPIKAPRAGERHRVTGACHIDEDGTAIRTVTVDQVISAINTLIK